MIEENKLNKNVINSQRKLSTSITRILLIYEEERMIRDMIRDTILISMEQILIPLIKGSLLDFSPWTVPDTFVHVLLGLLYFLFPFVLSLRFPTKQHISINKLPAGTFARVLINGFFFWILNHLSIIQSDIAKNLWKILRFFPSTRGKSFFPIFSFFILSNELLNLFLCRFFIRNRFVINYFIAKFKVF